MQIDKVLHRAAERIKNTVGGGSIGEDEAAIVLAEVATIERVADKLSERPARLVRSSEEWVRALLAQARADLRAAKRIAGEPFDGDGNRDLVPVFAMLLQMVFEKVGKAAIAKSHFVEFEAVRFSHKTASRMFKVLKNSRAIWHGKRRTIVKEAIDLEATHPALAKNGPHLEYPWENNQKVAIPAEDLYIVKRIRDANLRIGPSLLRLADDLLRDFDRLF